jgi:16S rRNA (adenine1518-N6/adenine1519-N6)-dimethyltransferase
MSPKDRAATESPRALLERFGLRPKRSFGQNFLSDPGITGRIADAACADARTVVEIGAGLGALTERLLERTERVIAIERDRDLIPILKEVFRDSLDSGKLDLREADAKSVDYQGLLDKTPGPHVLSGNLPYQITGPLLRLAMELAPRLSRAVFLVQKEVAVRMLASAGTEDYGALSVFSQASFEVQRLLKVGAGAFYPAPKVDSMVVTLTPLAAAVHVQGFDELVRLAFQNRRKTLRNAWNKSASAEKLNRAAEQAGIDLGARGEQLAVGDFQRMARALIADL